MELAFQILILVALLLISGIASAAEIALVSLSKPRVRYLVDNKARSSNYIKQLKDNPHRMIGTILIVNNLVNVGASAMITSMMISVLDSYAVGIATGVMTLLILIFGEITPKSIAAHNNELIAKIVAAPLWYASIIFFPFLYILEKIIHFAMRLMNLETEEPPISEEEIISMVKEAEEEGAIKPFEKNIIGNIFDMDNIQVSDIITPVSRMINVDASASISHALKIFRKSWHSRMPVYDGYKSNIVGILLFKDIIPHINDLSKEVRYVMKKPYFVLSKKRVSNLLRNFQKRKEHMAIVVDDMGKTLGLATLEDVLEELVGEIMDEKDRLEPSIQKVTHNIWDVNGAASVNELNSKLHMGIPDGSYSTLHDFLLFSSGGQLPKQKKSLFFGRFVLMIKQTDGNIVQMVRIEKR